MVVGAGGLGCPTLQYLVGMGIGTVGIADHDTIHLSNLHRQILYTESEIGMLKVQIASQRLRHLNSNVRIVPVAERITPQNVDNLFQGYDIVVDCTDNFESRKTVSEYSSKSNIPLVYGAVQQFEGIVSVFSTGFTLSDLFPDQQSDDLNNCAQEGIMGHVAGHVACLMVNEVVKIILGLEGVLLGKVLTTDLKTGIQRTLLLNKPHPL